MKAKKIFERVNFERGQDPKEAMEIGLWKPFKDVFVTIEKFKENGGVLTEGRIIFNENGSQIGVWIGYDESQKVDIMKGNGYQSFPVNINYGVKIKAKVIYK